MAVRYLDPEDGNDAADGLSFASRKKTWLSASTGMAAGDEIRVIASPGPNNIGSGTWTDNSRSVAIPAGLVKTVDEGLSGTGWVAAANITLSTSTSKKVLTAGTTQTFIVATAFTTGKVAHKTLGAAMDLSAFQSLSMWVFSSLGSVPVGSLELRLCSDTTGDVPVATLPFDDGVLSLSASGWNIAFKDFGAALPSGIQSISIYANSDPGTPTFRFSNLIAAKGRDDPLHLSHLSLIGKHTTAEPEWYPLQAIGETSVVIGYTRSADELAASNLKRPYRGTTETVDTYAARSLALVSSDANRLLQVAGTLAAPCKITGGWRRSDMAAQDGVTWLNGRGRIADLLNGNSKAFWNVEKLGFALAPGQALFQNWSGWNIQLEGWLGCDSPFYDSGSMSVDAVYTYTCKQIWGMPVAFNWPVSTWPLKASIDRIHGGAFTGAAAYTGAGGLGDRMDIRIGRIDNNAGYGAGTGSNPNHNFLRGTRFDNNDQGDLFIGTTDMTLTCHNCTLGSATKYTVLGTASRTYGAIVISAEGGDPTKHTIAKRATVLTTDAAVRHSPAGVSWKFTLTTNAGGASAALPQDFKLADIAVKAGSTVTVKCWMQRDSASLTAGIYVKDGWIAGVTETRSEMTAAAGAWEQRTLTFTPTQDGIVPIHGYAHGALASAWFDDLEIT